MVFYIVIYRVLSSFLDKNKNESCRNFGNIENYFFDHTYQKGNKESVLCNVCYLRYISLPSDICFVISKVYRHTNSVKINKKKTVLYTNSLDAL